MKNIYHEHLEKLRSMNSGAHPATSLYLPLKWTDFPPARIFQALVKAANGLLTKDGHPKLVLQTPEWERWLKQGTITLALFHQNGVTHLIPLPTRMQPRVVVADSFHVKPIMAASLEYVDALLLHFNEGGASLFRVHPAAETLLDSYVPSETWPQTDWPNRLERGSLRDYLEFLQQEIRGFVKPTTKLLGVTGTGFPELRSEAFWKRAGIPVTLLEESFRAVNPHNSLSIVRLRLAQLIQETHAQFVMRSMSAKGLEEHPNLGTLAQKIMVREIRKLCVSLDCMHFGHLDPKSGIVTVNKAQQSASDDDLLDDLVELAIDRGIEVSVVPKKFLPEGRSFVAS